MRDSKDLQIKTDVSGLRVTQGQRAFPGSMNP
jgi:hypothetical protein